MEKSPKLTHRVHYRKFCALVYCGVLLPVLMGCLELPSVSVDSGLYEEVYFSSKFSLFKLVFYLFLVATGYMYVTGVTLRLKRKNPLAARNGSVLGFVYYLLVGLVMFWLGPNATLMDKSQENKLDQLLLYNYLCYGFCFFVSLHFTYLDKGILKKVSFNIKDIASYSNTLKVIFGGVVVALLGLLGVQFYFLYEFGRLWIYLVALGVVVVCLGLTWAVLSKTHVLHIHHYMIGLVFIPFTALPVHYSAALQGVSLGLFAEGSARWGLEPLFKKI